MPSPLPLVPPPWQQSYRSYSGILPMNTNMNKEIIGEIHKSTIPRNASFSGNKQNTGPNESSRNPPPPSRVHPPIRAGSFRQNLPSPLPACLPVSLTSPRASLGTFEARSEYSDLPTRALAGRGEGIRVWLSGTHPPPKVAVLLQPRRGQVCA